MTLQELLGDELYNQVTKKAGDKHKIAIVSDGNWFPKNKWDEVNTEKNEYKTQVEGLNTTLGELKAKLKDNEDAAKTIDGLKQQIADKEKELAGTRKLNAIKLEILKASPNDVSDILPHIKQDSITISDDGIKGLKEQLEAIRQSKPYLFKEADPDGTGGSKGGGAKGARGTDKNPWSKEYFNLTEQMKLYREDPEKAKALKAAAK